MPQGNRKSPQSPTIRHHGAFQWVNVTIAKDGECWHLVKPHGFPGFWNITNYGKAQYEGSAFSGWRFGSGGPFSPPCKSFEEAADWGEAYLINRMASDLKQTRQLAETQAATLAEVLEISKIDELIRNLS